MQDLALQSLFNYFKDAILEGKIDHSLRARLSEDGASVSFYVHPANADGQTLDFVVTAAGGFEKAGNPIGG